MDNFRSYFLNTFEEKISRLVIEFGKRLSSTNASVYIAMARKAACLIECMEDLKLVDLNGFATTDKILDMDLGWLKGRDIVIIDDIIITGTTLRKVVIKLLSAEVKSITIHVICTNKKYFRKDVLIIGNKNYLFPNYEPLENNECIKVSADIVKALSIYPRPYSIDYPLFKGARISKKLFGFILNDSDWDRDEITSSYQQLNNVFSLTLTPSIYMKKKINNCFGFNICKGNLLKIRIYGKLKQEFNNREIYYTSILPIIALSPLNEEEITYLFTKILSNYKETETIFTYFNTPTSRLRFIQYYFAYQLIKYWNADLKNKTDTNVKLLFDCRNASFLFSPPVIDRINAIAADDTEISFEEFKIKFAAKNNTQNINETRLNNETNLIKIKSMYAQPFIDLYYTKELIARNLVKDKGPKVLNDKKYNDIMQRLEEGFSIADIFNFIPAHKYFDREKIISNFLDKSIDLGIVVPITCTKDNLYFRAYRHGEDILFGEAEENLCIVMLKEMMSNANIDKLPHIWVEKLIVLLIKIGVQNRFLYEFRWDIPHLETIRLARVKNYLFGEVATEILKKPGDDNYNKIYIDDDKKSDWLTNILEEKSLLKSEKQVNEGSDGRAQILYKIDAKDRDINNVDYKARSNAERMGEIFGILYKNNFNKKKPSISSKELVILTSCISPEDMASSLSAEISIFLNYWDKLKSFINSNKAFELKYFYIANKIRHHICFTAINSGIFKYMNFINKEAITIINNVAEAFPSKTYKTTWKEFWSPNVDWDFDSLPKNLKKIILELGSIIISLNFSLRIWEFCFRKRAMFRDKNLISQNNDEIRKLEQQLDSLLEATCSIQNYYLSGKLKVYFEKFILNKEKYVNDNVKQEMSFIEIQINDLVSKAFLSLESADLSLGSYGKVEMILEYFNALYIDIDEPDSRKREDIFKNIEDQIFKFEKKVFNYKMAPSDLESFYKLPFERNALNRGLWILSKGKFARSRLIDLSVSLYSNVSEMTETSIYLFPNLSEECTIKLVGSRSQNIKFGYFWELVLGVIGTQKRERFKSTYNLAIKNDSNQNNSIIEEILSSSNGVLSLEKNEIKVVLNPLKKEVKVSSFKKNKATNKMNVGIITILKSELSAIKENFKQKEPIKNGRIYYKTIMEGKDGDYHNVVLTQTLNPGNQSVISAYYAMMKEYNPSLIVLMGVAGSIDDSIDICDVVIADKIIHYDSRKETEKGVEIRGTIDSITPNIQVYLNDFMADYVESNNIEPHNKSLNKTFKIEMGPIGAGEAVITKVDSKIREWLKTVNSKTLAVETESMGLANAFNEDSLEQRRFGFLVIRGISDKADKDKKDDYKIPATSNAFKVFIELLKTIPSSVLE